MQTRTRKTPIKEAYMIRAQACECGCGVVTLFLCDQNNKVLAQGTLTPDQIRDMHDDAIDQTDAIRTAKAADQSVSSVTVH